MEMKAEEFTTEHHTEKEKRIKVETELVEVEINLNKATLEHMAETERIVWEC